MEMKVDFFCIGAQKAGTTTLHDILSSHPDIYLPPKKEAHFFDVNERYEKGLEFYFSTFFNTYNGEKIIGNINPNLEVEERSIRRLKECFGDKTKIIFIMRNPVDRAFSHYLMSKSRGYENFEFEKALNMEQYRFSNPTLRKGYESQEYGHFEKNNFGYIYRSHYLRTIDCILTLYPINQVKFVIFEEMIINKIEVITDILTFLDIQKEDNLNYNSLSNMATKPRYKSIRNFLHGDNIVKEVVKRILPNNYKLYLKKNINSINSVALSKEEKTLSPEDRKILFDTYFREEVIEIEKRLNINLQLWK